MSQISLFGETRRSAVVFDLETRESFDDVGGFQNVHKLRVSVGVLYDVDSKSYIDYTEDTMEDLVNHLFEADLVVGYNSLGFDYKVLQKYTKRDLGKLASLDLLNSLYQQLGFRVSLDNAAHATLNASKSADGLQAIKWWRAGEIEKLKAYCRQDVKVTYDLYEYGRTKGYVYVPQRTGGNRKVPVNWK